MRVLALLLAGFVAGVLATLALLEALTASRAADELRPDTVHVMPGAMGEPVDPELSRLWRRRALGLPPS